MSRRIESDVTLVRNEDGWWTARDDATGVASQGETKEEALENLAEALRGYEGEGDTPMTAELREAGIDPSANTSGSLDDSEIFE